MRAVVVYESMYGNTRKIAEAIGAGLGTDGVAVVPVADATDELLAGVALLVVGGPTHAWGLSRPGTRQGARQAAEKPGSGLVMEPGAAGPGLRDWFASLGGVSCQVAAFDTHLKGPFSGRASRSIARELRRHGSELAAKPQSFLVSKRNELLPGEEMRARNWGAHLAEVTHLLQG